MAGAGRLRRWVLRPAVWALAGLALLVGLARLFLASDLARERARDLLVARLSDTLERPVSIARTDFSLLPLGLVLEGVEIASDRAGEPPLARVRRLVLEGDLDGIRRSEVVLRTVAIDGLDLHLEFRPDGSDNLPRPRRSGAASRQLALRVDGLSIADSTVTVAERRARVDVRARAVVARLVGLGGTDLVGSVVAQEVELGLPGRSRARARSSTGSATCTARSPARYVSTAASSGGGRPGASAARSSRPASTCSASGSTSWPAAWPARRARSASTSPAGASKGAR